MPESSSTNSAPSDALIQFGSCRLDRLAQRLERDGMEIHLEPKVWQLLCFLLERPGRVVTKDELLGELWPGVAVSDSSLTRVVAVLRGALGDHARAPRYIETVHRRGFRFIADVSESAPSTPAAVPEFVASGSGNERFVGRTDPIARLGGAFAKVEAGVRQVVFVEGEAGIGKTSLIDQFLAMLPDGTRRVSGRCIEHHATAEPYHPVLSAIESLARTEGDSVLDVLRTRAPSWLAQMPWLTGDASNAGQGVPGGGASGPRMLRELPGALEDIAADRPLVLVIEDLHWSDPATIDFVNVLASRDEAARLLLLATYRGAHAIAHGHPVVSVAHGLRRNERCRALSLEPLTADDIQEYVSRRFESASLTAKLAPALYERTDGHSLFLTAMVDHLVDAGWIVREEHGWELSRPIEDLATSGVPEDLRMAIELQLGVLESDARTVLEAASVMGERFAVEAVAAAVDRGAAEIEPVLEHLAQSWQMIRRSEGPVRWPDGTAVSYYRFRHAVYRSVLYEKIAPLQRTRIHQQLGERIEAAFAGETFRVCVELAGHFQRSGDAMRCVVYSLEAANQAHWRFAPREAEAFFTAAVASLTQVSADPAHGLLELRARLGLALTRLMRQEGTTAEDEENFVALERLCREIEGDTPRFRALERLFRVETLRSRADLAAPVAEEMVAIAERLADPRRSMVALLARGSTQVNVGAFEAGIETLDAGWSTYRDGLPAQYAEGRRHRLKWIDDGLLISTARMGQLAILGRLHEALDQVDETLALASAGASRLTGVTGLLGASLFSYLLGKLDLADRAAQEGLALATEEEMVGMQAAFEAALWCIGLHDGRIRADDPNVLEAVRGVWEERLRDKLSTAYPMGPLFLLHGCLQVRASTEGLRVLDELLPQTRATKKVTFEAELLRVQGELVLMDGADDAAARAEECFRHAREWAHERGARFWELRALLSLARLGCDPPETSKAHVAEVLRFFDAQPDIGAPDIIEARNLLNE